MRTMKDSEIGWIGQIPKNWLIKQAKFVLDIYTGATPKSQVPEYWDGDILWVTPADYKTEDVYITDTKKHITQSGYESCSTTIVPRGSLIFSKRAPIGTVAIADKDLCTNQGCLACVCNNNALYKYIYYQMQSLSDIFNSLGEGTTFLEISYSSFRSVKFVLPSLSEQKAIADYLDDKCAKIDTTIAKRKAIIEKLKDYKSAVIIKTVTKGLNPDAVMKDSGLKWVDTIPIHWNAKRLKFLVNTSSGSTPNSKTREYYENGNLNWIQSGDLYNKTFIEAVAKKITELAIKECRLKFYIAPFLVVAMYGASIGNISISLIDSYTNQACCVLLPKVDVNIKFLYYAISVAKTDLLAEAIGGSQPNISQDKINNLKIPLPPVNEQQEIAYYLDSQCAKIDEAIAKQEQAVTKLEEYRKSIIYYAVTGKIDCRDI